MTTKKIPISFNDQNQKNMQELIDLMGISGVYGDIPKAVKFGINLALSAIKNPQKVYHDLDTTELEIFFTSIRKSENIRKVRERYQIMKENAK